MIDPAIPVIQCNSDPWIDPLGTAMITMIPRDDRRQIAINPDEKRSTL